MAKLLVLFILAFATFFTSRADLIAHVCRKSTNPSFCYKVLRSDPNTRTADLPGLGKIVLDKAIVASEEAITAAKSLSKGDYGSLIDTCVETCSEAIDNLNKSGKFLPPRSREDVDDLKTRVSAAETDVETCDDQFDGEPIKLRDATGRARDIISILLDIANSFSQ